MRYLIFLAIMIALIIYAWRDWFVALCGMVLLTAVSEHPGMPRLTEFKGVTYWSVTALGVFTAWLFTRRGRWNVPRRWLILLALYLTVEAVAFTRTCLDVETFNQRALAGDCLPGDTYTGVGFFVDYLYTPLRYVLVGFMLMDGARSRRNLALGIAAVVLTGFFYSLAIIKAMPLSSLLSSGGELLAFRHRISRETGKHPNDIAVFLTTTFWVGLAVIWTIRDRKRLRLLIPIILMAGLFALLHTHSRGGYVGFVATGVVLCILMRAWKTLGVAAGVVACLCVIFPAIPARMLTGFDMQTGSGEVATNMDEVSAGRWTGLWPAAIEGIEESPLVGHGYFGFTMSSANDRLIAAEGGGALHPHNAYLEALLDTGFLGASFVVAPLVYVLVVGLRLVRTRADDAVVRLVGLAGVAAAATLLVQGLTGQHFGLHENMLFFWYVAGLVIAASAVPQPLRQPEYARGRGFLRTGQRPLLPMTRVAPLVRSAVSS